MKNVLVSKISDELLRHNILPNCSGYFYLRDCIILCFAKCAENRDIVLKYDIYEALSKKYKKSVPSIEKAISNCIEKSFSSLEVQNKYSELVTKNYKLSNKAFIMQLVIKIRSALSSVPQEENAL